MGNGAQIHLCEYHIIVEELLKDNKNMDELGHWIEHKGLKQITDMPI